MPLSQWKSFFAIPAPAVGKVDDDTSHEKITSKNSFGVAPDQGASFAAELEQLLKTGHKYLPGLADNYSDLSVPKADDNIDAALTREGEKSPVYGPWTELFGLFETMITGSESNLRDAAAEELRKSSSYFEK